MAWSKLFQKYDNKTEASKISRRSVTTNQHHWRIGLNLIIRSWKPGTSCIANSHAVLSKQGLKGVENVYTQHNPVLREILEDLIKSKLREDVFPFLGGAPSSRRVQDVVVFVVGGTTYEEAFVVHQLNKSNGGVRVVLGATHVHNTASFLAEVQQATEGTAKRHARFKDVWTSALL